MEEQASVDVEDVALQRRDPRRRLRPQLRPLIRLLLLPPLHEVAVQRPPVCRDGRVGAAGVECVSVEDNHAAGLRLNHPLVRVHVQRVRLGVERLVDFALEHSAIGVSNAVRR